MYLAELLNSRDLFQSASNLVGDPSGKDDIAEFLFRATSEVIHIERIQQLHQTCLYEYQLFTDTLQVTRERIVLGSPTVVMLANEIPPLLNTLRIMQNMVLPMCARARKLRCSVAASLNDAVRGLHTYPFPQALKKRTLAYWQSSGRHLKDYRDLDQHYRTIATRILLQLQPELRMLVQLPDNPSTKRVSEYTFVEGRNALEYIPKCFSELHVWVEDIAGILGCKPSPIKTFVGMSQLGTLVPPTAGTIALIVEHDATSKGKRMKAVEISQLEDGRLQVRQIFR